jgi:hypothetical protein
VDYARSPNYKTIKPMIKVKYTPNQESRSETFNYSDFGLSREEWIALSEDDKRSMLNEWVEHEPPYWTVDYFTEEPE